VSWVWRVFPGPLPRLNSKNSIPLIIFNLIGPSESFPSPKAPYSVLLSLTYLGGLGHLASHIWRTGDAWRTPGSSLKDAWIKSDGGPLLYERYGTDPGGIGQLHLSTIGGQGGQDQPVGGLVDLGCHSGSHWGGQDRFGVCSEGGLGFLLPGSPGSSLFLLAAAKAEAAPWRSPFGLWGARRARPR